MVGVHWGVKTKWNFCLPTLQSGPLFERVLICQLRELMERVLEHTSLIDGTRIKLSLSWDDSLVQRSWKTKGPIKSKYKLCL